MKIETEVLKILSEGVIAGNSFALNCGQLDRKLYLKVNKVLDNIGGKWDRKSKAHLFESDPTDRIDEVLLTGETVKEKDIFQFFETPVHIAEQMIESTLINRGDVILEPSAGNGRILDVLPKDIKPSIYAIDINPKCVEVLLSKGYNARHCDFLKFEQKGYDEIFMNPPFTRQQDIDHVLHAYGKLNAGGILVAIMSSGFTFRSNKKSKDFLSLVNEVGDYNFLPEGSFKESGTMVNTVMVRLRR
jgi:hypothetical protein